MKVDEPVQVYEAWNWLQAQFVCNLLIEAGIRARVASHAVESLVGKVPYQTVNCPVWVAAADEAQARQLVEEYDRRRAGRGSQDARTDEVFCYHCGQAVEAGQTPCPSCGLELDWSE